MPRTPSLDPAILTAALTGLQIQAERLDQQIAQVRALLGRRPGRPPKAEPSTATPVAPRKRRRLSAEGRARIVAAAKKRWAEIHKRQKAEAAKKVAPAPKPTKTLTPNKSKAARKAPPARAAKRPVKKAAPKVKAPKKAPAVEQTAAPAPPAAE